MDNGYNAMITDLHYMMMEYITSQASVWLNPIACSSSILPLLGSIHRSLFKNVHNTYTCINAKEN
jgi:hypothetical protein